MPPQTRDHTEWDFQAQAITFESRDKMEGTSAFLEKRRPRFTGE